MLTEDFQLDLSGAEQQIDALGASLTQVAQTFKADLADSFSALDQGLTAEVAVEADTSAIPEEVDAAVAEADPTVEVTVDADTTQAEAEIAAVDAPPIEVEVDANTEPAQAALDDLAASATSASGPTNQIGASLEGIGAGAAAAEGGVAGITGVLAGLPIAGAAAAAGVVVVAKAADDFFNKAVKAEAATQRFNETFGAFAEEVNQINVGNLNTSLADLALELGSSASGLRNSLSNIGQLGAASGIAADQVAKTAEQVAALSARAVALNPNLGEVGDVAASLTKGLARGGRFAAGFGIALTSAEINARALADTGKSTAAELTVYEKSAAGAALATEKLGNHLEEDIAKGTNNPIIQLRELTAQFNKASVEIGKPLVSPIFDLLKTVEPLAIGLAQVLGGLAEILVPVLDGILSGIEPIIGALVEELVPAFQKLVKPIGDVATSFGELIASVAPLISVVAELVSMLVDGIAPVLEFVAELLGNKVVQGLILAVGGFFLLNAALTTLQVLLVTNPVGLLAVSVGLLVGAIVRLNDSTKVNPFEQFGKDVDAASKSLATAFTTTKDGLSGLAVNLAFGTQAWKDYLTTQSEFAKDDSVLRGLRQSGIGLDELTHQLGDTGGGFEAFANRLIKAGQIKVEVNGVEQAITNWNDLTDAQKKQIEESSPLLQAFSRQQAALEDQSKAQLDNLVLNGQVTQQQVDQTIAFNEATGAGNSYQAALEAVTVQMKTFGGTSGQTVLLPIKDQQQAWLTLADSVAKGEVGVADFQSTADSLAPSLGVSADSIKGFEEAIATSVQNIASDIISAIPPAVQVFADLDAAAGPKQLLEQLSARVFAITNFTANLRTILESGAADSAALISSLGPEAAQQFADQIRNNGPDQALAFEAIVDEGKTKGEELRQFITNELAPQIAGQDIPSLAQQASDSLGLNLNLAGAAVQPADDLRQFFADSPQIQATQHAAESSGVDMGNDLADGIASGLGSPAATRALEQAGNDAIQHVEDGARSKAESDSPSKLFARLGVDLTDGLAVGLDDGSAAVVAAAEQIVADAASVFNETPPLEVQVADVAAPLAPVNLANIEGAPLVGAASAPTTINIGSVPITVNAAAGTTPEQVAALTAAAGAGLVDGIQSQTDAQITMRGA